MSARQQLIYHQTAVCQFIMYYLQTHEELITYVDL